MADNTISTSQLANKLNVEPRTIQRWVKDHGMPQVSRGKFSPTCLWWIIEHYQKELKRQAPTQDAKDIKLEHEKVKLQIDEEKLALVRGENTPNKEIAGALAQLGFTIKSSLGGMKKLANKLNGLTVNETVEELNRFTGAILKEISETQVTFEEENATD